MPISAKQIEELKRKIQVIGQHLIEMRTEDTTDEIVRLENKKALSELQQCLSASSPDELEGNLKEYLANRWQRICNSTAGYNQRPQNEINLLCLELAHMLSPLPKNAADEVDYSQMEMGQGPYFLLMPSLKVHETVLSDNIHEFKLHEFVLSDNGELFIPLMPCLERAHESDTGEMRHQVMDPLRNDKFPPLLTPSEVRRIADHSEQIKEYYELIEQYNQKRLYNNSLAAELSKLAQALIHGGAQRGGEEYDSGAAANIGIHNFNQFWEEYPAEKKKWALEHYTHLPLREALGRLNRPNDVDYLEVSYCVELIESSFISPIVEQIKEEEVELRSLKEGIISKGRALKEAIKQNDFPVHHKTAKQPRMFCDIFQMSKPEQQSIFKHTPDKSALRYALEHEPLALPDFVDLVADEKKEMIEGRFSPQNMTALMCAAKVGGERSVALLLEAGADPGALDVKNNTALHLAAGNGHNEVVKLLIAQAQDASIIDKANFEENTPALLAAIAGHTDVVTSLLEAGANIILRNRIPGEFIDGVFWYGPGRGNNVLDIALAKHPQLIKPLLLKAVALPEDQQKSFLARIERGCYPNVFIYAAERHPLLLDSLITELKKQPRETVEALLKSKNNQGETLLMNFASSGRTNAVRELIDLGASLQDVDGQSNTVLHKAARHGHAQVVDLLLDAEPELMNKINAEDERPFHLAIKSGGQVVRVFLEKNVNLDLRNAEGENFIEVASRSGSKETMKQLLCKAITLAPEQQRACLSQIDEGIYSNVLIYTMSEYPNCVPDLMEVQGRKDDYLAAKNKMDEFFRMDDHLAPFRAKLKEMERKARTNERYLPAVMAAKVLIRDLEIARYEFLTAAPGNPESRAQLKQKCLAAVDAARPELEKHREWGWGKLIAAFVAVVVTFPISLTLMALGVFSLKTDSEQKLNQLKKSVDRLDGAAHGEGKDLAAKP